MGNFCGNCGAQLEENAKVCGNCGMPVNAAGGKGKKAKIKDPKKNTKKRGKMKLAVVFIILLIAAAAGLKIASEFSGSKGLLRKVMTAYDDYDISTLHSLASNMYVYTQEDYLEQYLERNIGGALDMFEMNVGHTYKLSYEVKEFYDMSERRRTQTLNQITLIYPDFNINSIQEIKVAEVCVIAQQDGKTAQQNVTVTMTKENGSWRWLYLE